MSFKQMYLNQENSRYKHEEFIPVENILDKADKRIQELEKEIADRQDSDNKNTDMILKLTKQLEESIPKKSLEKLIAYESTDAANLFCGAVPTDEVKKLLKE